MRRLLRQRQGTTLVELVVCMLLLSVFTLAAVSLIQPCAQLFLRMQALSRAQMVSDTVVDYLQGKLLHAQGTLRLCDEGTERAPGQVFAPAADPTGSTGSAVEFQLATNVEREENEVGRGDSAWAFQLIDAGYVPVTATTKAGGGMVFGAGQPAGVLHERYFLPEKDGTYRCRDDAGQFCAYAGTAPYAAGFYRGMAVRLRFQVYSWQPRQTYEPVRVTALDVLVEVYDADEWDSEDALPLHSRRAILDLADAPELVQGRTMARENSVP